MTIDSELTKAETIEDIPRRVNISRGLTISLLAHTFIVWTALGFPFPNFDLSKIFKREIKAKQETIVTLHEGPQSYYKGPQPYDKDPTSYQTPVGFDPKIPQGTKTQTTSSEKPLGTASIQDKTSVQSKVPKEKPESLEEKIDVTLKTSTDDVALRNRLEEIYNHTYKPDERNEASYVEFFIAHLNAYLKAQGLYQEVYHAVALENMFGGYAFHLTVKFHGNGRFEVVKFQPSRLMHREPITIRIYERELERLPKVFTPPKSAGLQSPFVTYYYFNGVSNFDP